jgi:hypothetical protein
MDRTRQSYEQMVMEAHAVGQFPVAEIIRVIAGASVARTSFSLCSAAIVTGGVFDPVEFGHSCEAIARQQIERYRTAHERAGSAGAYSDMLSDASR